MGRTPRRGVPLRERQVLTAPQTHLSVRTPSAPARGSGESPVRTGPRHAWVAGTPAAPGEHPANVLVVALPALTAGHYALKYKVLAADGHVTESVLRFQVTAPR